MQVISSLKKRQNTHERSQNFTEEEKNKKREYGNKSWLSCDEMRKTKSLRNYKKFDKPNYWFFETDLVG